MHSFSCSHFKHHKFEKTAPSNKLLEWKHLPYTAVDTQPSSYIWLIFFSIRLVNYISVLFRFVLLGPLFPWTAFEVCSNFTDFGCTPFYISVSDYFLVILRILFGLYCQSFIYGYSKKLFIFLWVMGPVEMRCGDQDRITSASPSQATWTQCRQWTGQVSTLKWCESLEDSIYYFCLLLWRAA
jgi:hypothetical protein